MSRVPAHHRPAGPRAHRPVHRSARARGAAAGGRAPPGGVPRRSARNGEALSRAQFAGRLRKRLRASGAEGARAHRSFRRPGRRRGISHHRQRVYRLGRVSSGCPTYPWWTYSLPVPLPAKIEIEYGAPLLFSGTGNEDDGIVFGYVDQVKEIIAKMLAVRAGRRRGDAGQPEAGLESTAKAGEANARLASDSHSRGVGLTRRPLPPAPPAAATSARTKDIDRAAFEGRRAPR